MGMFKTYGMTRRFEGKWAAELTGSALGYRLLAFVM
jgi:hypothetical protein